MNSAPLKLYDVEFAAKITVAAHSQREALHFAYDILDSPHCYPTFIHEAFAYPQPMDVSKLDEPPITVGMRTAPAPDVDSDPLPF